MKYKIYCIENKITNKLYIGYTSKSINERLNQHLKNAKSKINRRLYDSMNYHGYENFSINKIDECKSQKDAEELESWYIYLLNSKSPDGYNMTWGGDGGYTLSNWTDEEIDKFYKRQQKSREKYWLETYGVNVPAKLDWVKEKISESHKGKELSESHKQSISNTLKEKYKNGELIINTSGLKNGHIIGEFTHSLESRKKISEYRTGKSYEDLYDIETSNRLKKEKSERWNGSGNPNYKPDLTDNERRKFIKLLIDNKKMNECSNITGHSEYKLRKFLRKVGINNIQRLRSQDTENIKLKTILQNYE